MSIRFSSKLALPALLSLLLAAGAARAQDNTASAREHYQKGTSYYDLGRYQDAIKEFEAAYELKNDPALLYNLAQSHRLAGNAERALHFYRTYLRRVPGAKNRAEIEGRIEQLEKLVEQKTATQNTPPNQTIPPVGTTPLPGDQQQPPGGPPVTTEPPVSTQPPPMPPPPVIDQGSAPPPMEQPPPPSGRGKGLKTAGLITAAAGGGLFIIGIIEGFRAAGAASDINDAAKKGNAFDPAVEDRGKAAEASQAAFMTLGVLAAGTGAVLYYLGRRKESEPQLTVTPVASAHEAGALLRVTF